MPFFCSGEDLDKISNPIFTQKIKKMVSKCRLLKFFIQHAIGPFLDILQLSPFEIVSSIMENKLTQQSQKEAMIFNLVKQNA